MSCICLPQFETRRKALNIGKHFRYIIFIPILFPAFTDAAWETVTYTNVDTNIQTRVARIENEEGYSLEIYRDASDAVRARINMNNNNRLKEKTCPTYQVDNNNMLNRSINDAPCISQRGWAEFILGYIIDNQINSTQLDNLLNGNRITYRFILENSGYAATSFSLKGSKQTVIDVLGANIKILPQNQASTQ